MNQARAASCSSSEASEDEAGSSSNLHSKLSKPLSSALLQKGATTLARISERPHSSPAVSQRSGKKRHGVTGTAAEESQDTNEDEEKLSPFQSACTQPRLRKGRENSNQDDSSDNQDSGKYDDNKKLTIEYLNHLAVPEIGTYTYFQLYRGCLLQRKKLWSGIYFKQNW